MRYAGGKDGNERFSRLRRTRIIHESSCYLAKVERLRAILKIKSLISRSDFYSREAWMRFRCNRWDFVVNVETIRVRITEYYWAKSFYVRDKWEIYYYISPEKN